MADESLRAEGNLHMAKDPMPEATELSDGIAENEKEPETSMQAGMARCRAEVMLPSNRENGVTHTEAEKVTNNNELLSVSPVLPAYNLSSSRRVSEGDNGQVPIHEGDGTLLLDEDGHCIYEQSGWRVLCDQHGMVL